MNTCDQRLTCTKSYLTWHLAWLAPANRPLWRAVADVFTPAIVVAARIHSLTGGLVWSQNKSILTETHHSLLRLRAELVRKKENCYQFV